MYFKRYMELEYTDSLTCAQLVKMITTPRTGEKHRKFEDVVDECLSQIDEVNRTATYKLYKLGTNKFLQFVGLGSLMEHITPIRINQYISWLTKAKLSSTAINIYITLLKVVINYAMKMRYVSYDGLRAVDREGYKTKR
nr:phage integrase SAM-like domain-containing protein [uncultured Bacteroides sp.]